MEINCAAGYPETIIKYSIYFVLLCSLSTLGCVATRSSSDQSAAPVSPLESNEIAPGFVQAQFTSVLTQILSPIETTIQVSGKTTRAEPELLKSLTDAGYAIQLIAYDKGPRLLDFHSMVIDAGTRYRLEIGSIRLERVYASVDGNMQPIGPLFVAGSRSPISLGDDVFFTSIGDDADITAIAYQPDIEIFELEPVNGISLQDVLVPPKKSFNSNDLLASNFAIGKPANLFSDTGFFQSKENQRTLIHRKIVIFPNDSLRLGRWGKSRVAAFIRNFNKQTDLIGIIGCSTGPTAFKTGNEGLALGRAERIKQELVSMGVGELSILDEGCWGPTNTGGRYPSRGVVLQLWRNS